MPLVRRPMRASGFEERHIKTIIIIAWFKSVTFSGVKFSNALTLQSHKRVNPSGETILSGNRKRYKIGSCGRQRKFSFPELIKESRLGHIVTCSFRTENIKKIKN